MLVFGRALFLLTCAAINRGKNGLYLGVGRSVWIVAIDAVVSFARTFGQIPMTVHTTMCTGAVVAQLRAMTLTAELHDVGVGDGSAVGFPERVVITGIVTGEAGKVTVFVSEALMKLSELGSGVTLDIRRARGMASRTRNGNGSA